jgi:hypothetical protein
VREAAHSPGAWAAKISRNCLPTLVTGLRAFIALWKTMETLVQRKARSSSPASAVTSTSVPSRPEKRTEPPVSPAGGRSILVRA